MDAHGKLSPSDELCDIDADGKLFLSDNAFHPQQRGKENRDTEQSHIMYIMLELLPHIPWPSV